VERDGDEMSPVADTCEGTIIDCIYDEFSPSDLEDKETELWFKGANLDPDTTLFYITREPYPIETILDA
jgi:hypothetical protein